MEPIHPYGLMLNLDEVDFKDREVCINDWVSSMRIAGDTLELEEETFIKLLEMNMLGTTKPIWERANENVHTQVIEAGSLTKIVNRMATYFKIQYIGIDYFDDFNVENKKLYTKALHSLKLESLEKNAINYFFTLFTTYQWQTGVGEAICVEILFPKFQALRKGCSSRNTSPENVARRISFVKMKLGEWCGQTTLQKNYKKQRSMNKCTYLDCSNNDLPTIAGGVPQRHKKSKKYRSHPYARSGGSITYSWRPRTIWSRQKARSYKIGQRSGPTRSALFTRF